jgi:uncharacterized protein (TIGR03905 family)
MKPKEPGAAALTFGAAVSPEKAKGEKMTSHTYVPKGVCSTKIEFDMEDGKLYNVRFTGGCNGNLKAIGRLVEGADAENISAILAGNQCGNKGTSCADQLSKAIKEALA